MPDINAKIEELANLLDEHGLTAIKITEGEVSIEIRRDVSQAPTSIAAPRSARAEGEVIPSPMTGVFYSRPSPSEEPFVQPGGRVTVGQVIGIIEAMKVFNEVESPATGTISQCMVEDGALVQEGDPLFVIQV